jgi:hypothetical protein
MPPAITSGRSLPLRVGKRLSGRDLSSAFNLLSGARGDNGMRVELRPGGMRISGGSTEAAYTRAFGWGVVSGQNVTIGAGLVLGFNESSWIAEQAVSVGGSEASPHMIVATGTVAPLSGMIMSVTIQRSGFTGHNSSAWYRPLWLVCLKKGRPTVLLDMTPGVIDLKSWFGP